MKSWRWPICLLVLLAAVTLAPSARGDGDPGSDVLAYQPVFLGSDAGIPVAQQLRLDALVRETAASGFPIRVAIVASPADLGSVTALWRKPQAYAKFLGYELSLAYRGRLLVVMPNGVGFSWRGHPTPAADRALQAIPVLPGGSGLGLAAEKSIRSLATNAGIKLGSLPASRAPAPSEPAPPSQPTIGPSHAISGPLAGLAAIALIGSLVLVAVGWRTRAPRSVFALALVGPAIALPAIGLGLRQTSGPPPADALGSNRALDPGTPLSRSAPDFTLTDQFGQPASLRAFRGKAVILAFNDSQCTTICPLATTAMLQAKRMLGSAGQREVQLLGVDANPRATSIEDVLSYSQVHGLTRDWRFLTGTTAQLKRVWEAYSVGVQINQGQVDHSPAVFLVDTHGRLNRLFVAQQSYAAVPQFAQILATRVSSLLPDRPAVHSSLSYDPIQGISPSQATSVPRAGGGPVQLGPGAPRLLVFFASWDQEITSLSGQLKALNGYARSAAAARLPALAGIDEASVEPSPGALSALLPGLPNSLSYPVGLDASGRIADGYQVQGQPWFVLTSASGQILWSWPVGTSGWLSRDQLARHVRAALAKAPAGPQTAAAGQRQLSGSPQPLATLHAQAAQLLGNQAALATRIRALHGYPIVINAWASWCSPCRAEFGLFASASATYGRQVAFLGANSDDSAADARTFLAQHAVSYPSYQTTTEDLRAVVPAGVAGLPTTLFLDRSGRLVYVHTGQYQSQGSLNADIETYAR
jgi:cytochrome oxidase Cu insertion factor (SCO1/SenC/PrrC family)/thiol-disulfide isomerase/thioredoxin